MKLLPLALVLALPLGASAQESGSFDRTLSVDGHVNLEVHSGAGSVRITPGPSDTVSIHGEIRVRSSSSRTSEARDQVRRIEEQPPINQEGNVIRIGMHRDDRFDGLSISYEIRVPTDTSLVSRTGSGSQSIGDFRGPVEARTGSGSIKIGATGASVEAATGSGSIEIESARGRVELKTGSGSITAKEVEGPITARSGSGSIELEQAGEGDVDVSSGSGSIRVSGIRGGLDADAGSGSIRVAGELAGDWHLEASSGRVTVELADDASFELDARTRSGSIDLDHPVMMTGGASTKRLQGTVRDGGYRLEIESGSGGIVIR